MYIGGYVPEIDQTVNTDHPGFSWDPVPGAISYTLNIDNGNLFPGAPTLSFPNIISTSTLYYDLKYSLGSGIWYWWETAHFPGGHMVQGRPRRFIVATGNVKPPEVPGSGNPVIPPTDIDPFHTYGNDSAATAIMWASAALVLIAIYGSTRKSRR